MPFCFLISILFLSLFQIQAEESFVVLEATSGQIVKVYGERTEERLPPCSTFKIALSLMGFDSGILKDETNPEWPYVEGYASYIESWKTSHTPRSWLKNSCLWYSQIIAGKLGSEKMQAYLNDWHYGNCDLTGDPKNEQSHPWLNSSLKISPKEQVYFLQKMLKSELHVAQDAVHITKYLLFLEDLEKGWKLFGKTGAGSLENGLQIGWLVGWFEKEGTYLIFAYQEQSQKVKSPQERISKVKALFKEIQNDER